MADDYYNEVIMSPAYKILGMSVQPHVLAIGTLLATGAGVYLGTGKNEDQNKAESKEPVKPEESEVDVEKLLNQFLESDTEKK